MIVRLWKTRVRESAIAEYEENELNRSLPMFKGQPGCVGAFFLRSEDHCYALTLWTDIDAVDRLNMSEPYREACEFYERSGMLIGNSSLQVFEAKDGFFMI
jgi:heme-degrading monooxygenase HmoA